MNNAFHFATLVWDWPIAIYLLLVGISSGMVIIAVLLKRRIPPAEVADDIIIRAATVIAPLAVMLGLAILIFHLARPWTFWYLMIYYNPRSVMSLGVMLFQVYMVILMLWILNIYHKNFTGNGRYARAARYIGRFNVLLDTLVAALAILLGVYTGCLLLALKSYPLLNNPILPLLFLTSGLASALAVATLCRGIFFNGPAPSSLPLLQRFEKPLIWVELSLLMLFFLGLFYGGEKKHLAALTALQGFWGAIFWAGIVGCGIVLPLLLNLLCNSRFRHRRGFLLATAGIGLCSVLLLRMFILYAGQMVTA
ncbi:cytochrome c nitrite reductase subunit NrfD [Acerihabitans arboris]|uniref:Cytochrome c nitrite reductase subunit NrfD n=1 Tax=Acerihabitans arboris TaxID=2691583 RepID=A0A845SJV8_9GAMM|nr:cytochrome c nitrite reductase subunit NrfD [Acerihabitans arboris]NDL63276.1 cytochrome c nitrite reductase subunit NrfD [Acerihabitans arboris]